MNVTVLADAGLAVVVGLLAGFVVGHYVGFEMVARMIRRDPAAFRARALRS